MARKIVIPGGRNRGVRLFGTNTSLRRPKTLKQFHANMRVMHYTFARLRGTGKGLDAIMAAAAKKRSVSQRTLHEISVTTGYKPRIKPGHRRTGFGKSMTRMTRRMFGGTKVRAFRGNQYVKLGSRVKMRKGRVGRVLNFRRKR